MPVFDPNAVEYSENSFTPVPVGSYACCILSAEEVPTKSRNGRYLDMQLEINDGPQQGRKLFHKITTENPSQTAVSIGQEQLKKICETNNLGALNSWDELCMRTVYVKVGHTEYNGEKRAIVKYFLDKAGAGKRQGAVHQDVRRNVVKSTVDNDNEPPF